MPTISTIVVNSGGLRLNLVIRSSLEEVLYNCMSLCVADWLSEKLRLLERDCHDSFGLLTIFLGLLMTLSSDWVKFLFVGLSGFCIDFPVLVSREVVWIIKKIRLVITSGYFKIWCQTSWTLISVPCGCFQFRFFSRSSCCTFLEVTCLVLWSYQATLSRCRHCEVVFFVNIPNIFATIFAQPSWST